MPRSLLFACLLSLAGLAPAGLIAQALAQATAGDADRLAAQMRLLAVNPNDLSALLAAGELSVRLDDLGAASSFFARADRIDPRNGRAKAGEGAILVHAERPGEALRYFALAESYGLAPAAFAADRGLAYDLVGEGERAQRDYRLALRTAPDEETQRRYALSLAIAGKRELAEQQLQPLLRQSDRGAWRVHAFVLAMGGNVAEASRIATAMMPPGTAAGLQPFLEKLPALGPVDRAFAVHFGEVASTPQRVADARLVRALPALGPDPYAPRPPAVTVAAVDKGKKREPKRHGKQPVVQVAVATPAPEPLPQAPAYRAPPGTPPVLATRGTAPVAWPAATPPIVSRSPPSLATATPPAVTRKPPAVTPAAETNVVVAAVSTPTPAPTPTPTPTPARVAAVSTAPVAVASSMVTPPVLDAGRAAAAPPRAVVAVAGAAPHAMLPTVAPPSAAGASGAGVAPISTAPAAIPVTPTPAQVPVPASISAPPPVAVEVVRSAPLAARSTSASQPAPTRSSPSLVALPSERSAVRRPGRSELSAIVAGLPIPASELGIVSAAPSNDAASAAKAAADKRAADRKAAADKKALADKKAAAAKKADEEREAAARKKIERANPERIWVQVAGGANAHDLAKAWAAAKAKGGDLFDGHATGWTTPLRFTNRVLAGPFKTDADARAFVNKAKTVGLSAFTFTSDVGQVVTKLSTP